MVFISVIVTAICVQIVSSVGPLVISADHKSVGKSTPSTRGCKDVGKVFLTSKEAGGSGRTGRIFCQGTLIYSVYILLPAHCIAAAKKLKSYQLQLRMKNGRTIYRSINSDAVFVNPEFRLLSYNKRDFLFNDIAIIALKYPMKPKTFTSARINLGKQSKLAGVMYDRRNAYHVTNDFDCDTDGLARNQICLINSIMSNITTKGRVQEHSEQLQLDPRQGYYRQSCWDKSGSALLTSKCQMEAFTLVSDCQNSVKIALRLDSYSDWIRSTIMTDLLQTKRWKKIRSLKRLFIREMRSSKTCLNFKDKQEMYLVPNIREAPTKVIEQSKPEFKPLSENLKVVTDCGVEVRLESGIIHSPIHYKDVKNSRELLNIIQNNFKYRPNQKCEWLVTAPAEDQKVGIKFQYFDLHPDFDRLEVEEDSGSWAPRQEVARFRGGKPTRTIISGSDQLRLTFHSDYQGERKGFGLTFQPVKVSQCGGSYFAQSGTIQSPNYPFFYPPNTICTWKIQVPGPATIKLEFDHLNLHTTDLLEIRDGLSDQDSYITSISGNTSNIVYTLANKMHVLFKTNDWGQMAGFSARFVAMPAVCGGREVFQGQSLSLHSPEFDRQGHYRRGYVSCRWEVHAEHRHFITVQFNQFDLGDKPQCATGFLELSDSVHDSDHMRRYCNGMEKKKWYTTSSKLFIEYLFDIDDTKSHFDIRLDQTKGCVLPQLPPFGKSMECTYPNSRKVECIVTCNDGVVLDPAYCYLYHGVWKGTMDCAVTEATEKRRESKRPLEKLLDCRHERLTGCLVPPMMDNSLVKCTVKHGDSVCRIECVDGEVSPGDYARCVRDRSGWEGRWSRVLLACIPSCIKTIPKVTHGRVNCVDMIDNRFKCRLRCKEGYSASLYNEPSQTDVGTFSCDRGVWSGVLRCVAVEEK